MIKLFGKSLKDHKFLLLFVAMSEKNSTCFWWTSTITSSNTFLKQWFSINTQQKISFCDPITWEAKSQNDDIFKCCFVNAILCKNTLLTRIHLLGKFFHHNPCIVNNSINQWLSCVDLFSQCLAAMSENWI